MPAGIGIYGIREFGVTVLLVERNLQMIYELAERCYVVDNGHNETELDKTDLDDTDTDTVADYLAV